MVSAVVSTIMDALSAVFTGVGTSLTTLWTSLIYDDVAGLTPFAEWMLVFMGFGLGVSILMALVNKVL